MDEEAGAGADSIMSLAQRPIAVQPKNTNELPDRSDPQPDPRPPQPLSSPSLKPGSPRSILNPLAPPTRENSPPAPRSMAQSGAATPQPKGSTPSPSRKSPEVSRPLNVTDALSYLDAVKNQFQDQPEVYNRFLDIMKDFKSQHIDTPGVIQRVSRLFHGNRELIQGFNTFLPLGYRIDVSKNPADPNTITVTTPMGTTIQNTDFSSSHLPRIAREIPGLGPNIAHPMPFAGISTPAPVLPPLGSVPASRSLTPLYRVPHTQQQQQQHQPPFDPPPFQNHPQTAAAASFLGNLNNRNPVEKQPPGEFNHAIQYLNKIKARYADDPNTYKQFLDILQAYQKEQRHLHDSQVYVQVQHLFKDAPDLLGEFKAFLPEMIGGQGGLVILPQSSSAPWPQPDVADKPAKKAAPPPPKRKKRIEKDPTPIPPPKPARPPKKAKLHHQKEGSPSSFSGYVGGHSPPPTMPPSAMSFQPPLQLPMGIAGMGATSADKLLFFDRAKKALENRQMYEDFLKLLSLFSKEVIDMKTLIERTRDAFLGDTDLMGEFKELVGWDESADSVEKGPPGSIRTGPPEALSALPADDGEGPSYRRLPDSESRLACSGRDELCRSVLNDEWVSHPTWASEDAGFVSHKKNSFEEALHKSEEERHEYHVQITALTRTIAHFEPLALRIEEMTSDERATFRLKPDFGGSGKCLYHRIIKKIYGRDGGVEIIQALQDAPVVAVPVVLTRLKQKDDEWRRAQREWGRTWREVDAKNFYKSLDHQGLSFKANDKKNITAKHFVADIEAVKAAQPRHWARSSPAPLEYSFADTPVLHDSLKMVYSFLDHSQGQYSAPERRSVESFLRRFVPLLCMYPTAEFNAACGPLDGLLQQQEEEHAQATDHASRSGRRSNGSAYSVSNGMGVAAGDLRKKLLRTAQEKNESGLVSRAGSPAVADIADVWIKETTVGRADPVNGSDPNTRRPFFANTTFYTLLRLLQVLYSRLAMCKAIGARLAEEKHASLLVNPVASALGLDDPAGPPVVLAQTIQPLGAKDAGNGAPPNVVYMYLLDACEKVFDNELDQATFEEHMRWFFGEKAYHLFTMDKLITALVKQVQTIVGDNKCQELWTLLQSANAAAGDGGMSDADIVRYRHEAEQHVGQDDHLYRLEWVRDERAMRVFLMGSEDASVDGNNRWREYVTTYVLRLPTEWVPPGPVDDDGERVAPTVFLKRTRRVGDVRAVVVDDAMCVRIEPPKYKLVYEAGAEDFVWWPGDRTGNGESHVRAAAERRRACLVERYS
ncbi:histone deacetylase complex, SIN3 component [Mycena maculata]|uniref:Histone deacetylase complex, SIN3 component n=1 Tax=Mycena maculata TaxID=230809 RepID=A0AAD7JFL8_9AGAR|nr:histone deacetylase complex, SIN3 component [Mycena maculata]